MAQRHREEWTYGPQCEESKAEGEEGDTDELIRGLVPFPGEGDADPEKRGADAEIED